MAALCACRCRAPASDRRGHPRLRLASTGVAKTSLRCPKDRSRDAPFPINSPLTARGSVVGRRVDPADRGRMRSDILGKPPRQDAVHESRRSGTDAATLGRAPRGRLPSATLGLGVRDRFERPSLASAGSYRRPCRPTITSSVGQGGPSRSAPRNSSLARFPFGNWSSRSHRHAATIARTSCRQSFSSARSMPR